MKVTINIGTMPVIIHCILESNLKCLTINAANNTNNVYNTVLETLGYFIAVPLIRANKTSTPPNLTDPVNCVGHKYNPIRTY